MKGIDCVYSRFADVIHILGAGAGDAGCVQAGPGYAWETGDFKDNVLKVNILRNDLSESPVRETSRRRRPVRIRWLGFAMTKGRQRWQWT